MDQSGPRVLSQSLGGGQGLGDLDSSRLLSKYTFVSLVRSGPDFVH